MHFDARGSGGIGAIAVRSCMRDVAARHTLVRARTVPLGFRRRGLAGPGLPGGVARFVGRVEKCLCVARKFNSGLYNGIESPERSQRTTRHPGAPLPPGNSKILLPIRIPNSSYVSRHRDPRRRRQAALLMAQFSNCAIAAIARYAAAEHTPPRGRGECGVALSTLSLAAPDESAVPAVRCPGVDRAGGPAVSVTARRRVDRQSDAA